MWRVAEFRLRPGGSPVAVNVRESPSGSEALMDRSTVVPMLEDCAPGLPRLGGEFTKVVAACWHCMLNASIQLPERPDSAKAGLPESQRYGPPAVPVLGPTAPRK